MCIDEKVVIFLSSDSSITISKMPAQTLIDWQFIVGSPEDTCKHTVPNFHRIVPKVYGDPVLKAYCTPPLHFSLRKVCA